MPTNVTPEYRKAEAAFREARTIDEKTERLQDMISLLPKHKGTDHLRGDLRKRLSQLREEQRAGGKKGGARRADPGNVPRQGAGQVVLLGPTNSGTSRL